jgi:hypothetical protein
LQVSDRLAIFVFDPALAVEVHESGTQAADDIFERARGAARQLETGIPGTRGSADATTGQILKVSIYHCRIPQV